MAGPSVFTNTQVIPEWLVLQYFQIHELYQNGRSFTFSRYTRYTKLAGFSAFPDSRILKMVGFQYFQVAYTFQFISHDFNIYFASFSHVSHVGPEFEFQPPQYNGSSKTSSDATAPQTKIQKCTEQRGFFLVHPRCNILRPV